MINTADGSCTEFGLHIAKQMTKSIITLASNLPTEGGGQASEAFSRLGVDGGGFVIIC